MEVQEIPSKNIICIKAVKRQSEALRIFDFVKAKSVSRANHHSREMARKVKRTVYPFGQYPWVFTLKFSAN